MLPKFWPPKLRLIKSNSRRISSPNPKFGPLPTTSGKAMKTVYANATSRLPNNYVSRVRPVSTKMVV